jgi:hypothetical protein
MFVLSGKGGRGRGESKESIGRRGEGGGGGGRGRGGSKESIGTRGGRHAFGKKENEKKASTFSKSSTQ